MLLRDRLGDSLISGGPIRPRSDNTSAGSRDHRAGCNKRGFRSFLSRESSPATTVEVLNPTACTNIEGGKVQRKGDDPCNTNPLKGNEEVHEARLGIDRDPVAWTNEAGEKVRQQLLQVLASRRKEEVSPEIYPGEHHKRPYFQQDSSVVHPLVLTLCPKGDARCNDQELEEEDLILLTETGEQGKVPFLLMRPKKLQSSKTVAQRPVVICIHSTGNSKETMRPFMKAYASLGYITVGVDARYHGDRGHTAHAYADALVAAWKTGQDMPFILDTVWDVMKLINYLSKRPDVDPTRIGMMGISLGGMITWFAAAADPRIAVAVPLIGVQSFGWAVTNDRWHARVDSIPHPFQVAAQDLGKSQVDSETVAAVWERLTPGIMDILDSPHTIPAIAPRPLLIHNGKDDPRCPVEGLESVVIETAKEYKAAGVAHHFKFIAEEGLGHSVTEAMGVEAICWFNRFLRPGAHLTFFVTYLLAVLIDLIVLACGTDGHHL